MAIFRHCRFRICGDGSSGATVVTELEAETSEKTADAAELAAVDCESSVSLFVSSSGISILDFKDPIHKSFF